MRSPYGKKGGTSATAGKVASTYAATLPNGRAVQVRSFKVSAPEAWVICYPSIREGGWSVNTVRDVPHGWSATEVAVPATKV